MAVLNPEANGGHLTLQNPHLDDPRVKVTTRSRKLGDLHSECRQMAPNAFVWQDI